MARVASAPFSSGIDRSISTTSGCESRACCTASRPSPTSATTSHVGLGLDQVLQALGHHAVVVGDQDADRHGLERNPGVDARALPRARHRRAAARRRLRRARASWSCPSGPRRAARGSKPRAVVVHVERPALRRWRTRRRAPASRCACLSTLLSASCAMRNSATAASGRARFAGLGRRGRRPSTCTPVRRENSSACQPSAAARPYSSSSGGRRSAITFSIDCSVPSTRPSESSSRWRSAARQRCAVARDDVEVDVERRQALADAVVQLAREPPALGLLGLHQAPRQAVQVLRRLAQRALGVALLGDVEAGDQDLDRLAALVAHHLALAAHVAHLAARAARRARACEKRAAVHQRARHHRARLLAVLGMHALEVVLEARLASLAARRRRCGRARPTRTRGRCRGPTPSCRGPRPSAPRRAACAARAAPARSAAGR